MSELKKLFQVKRILAMVLAAAMTITSLPATALAAEPVDTSTVTEADAEDTSAQSSAEIEMEGEQTSQLPAETPEDVVDDTETADQSNQVSATDAEQNNEDSVQTQAEGDAADGVRAAELGTSVIDVIDYLVGEYDADGKSPVADADGKKLSTDFLGNFYIEVNEGTDNYKFVWLNNLSDSIVETVTYQWFAGDTALGEAKKLAEEGALPTEAGEYTLKLVLPAKADAYEGAEAAFSYEINKPEVTVSIGTPATVAVGTKWSDVPVPYIYGVSAYSNGKNFIYATDDPDTELNEAADNEVAFKVVIKDAATGVTLTGDQTLVKDGEYMLSVVPEFIGTNKEKYEKNYTWAHCEEQKITIGELKATRLTLTPDETYEAKAAAVANDDNERTVQIIEAESCDEKLQELKYKSELQTEDGVDEQGKTKWKTLEGETDGAWYTAASYSEPWTEGTKTYCNLTLGSKMDTVPTTTGAYVYRVSYEGDQKEYAGCYADILVIIDAAEIIVRPTVSEQIVFYDGELVSDVLSQITYVLPYADGRQDNGKPALYPQTDNMWGTSYEPSGVTQPYKPDFELVEIIKDKDGNEIDRNIYESDDYAVLTFGNEYIVRFNGYKNVYTADGSVEFRKGINAQVDSMDPATCGFKVKTDADTLEADVNTVKIEVVKKDKEIDVTEIEKAATEKAKMEKENFGELVGAYTKTYDGSRIFDLYADYKKAKLKSGTSDPVKDFRYQWQVSKYEYEDLLATHKETVDGQAKDVPDVSKETFENEGNWKSSNDFSQINAGIYRLEITYRNSRIMGYAEPAYVYFVIKKQEITLTFDENTTLTGNVGNNLSVFKTNHAKKINEGTMLTPSKNQPTKAEDWKNEALLTTSANYAYKVTWEFCQKEKVTNEEGQEIDEYNSVSVLQSTGEFFLIASDIRLGWLSSGHLFHEFDVENYDVKNDVIIPITVKAMGTDAIKFDGITTPGGKMIQKTKTYDGKSIYDLIKDDLEALNKPIIIKPDETTGAETKVPVTFAEDEDYRLTYTVLNRYNSESKTYDTLPTDEESWAWAKNGGIYVIRVERFNGNERYAPLSLTTLATITVDQMEVVISAPTLTEEFEAGQPITDVLNAARREFNRQETMTVRAYKDDETIPDADMEKYFTKVERNGQTGLLAWYSYGEFGAPNVEIYDSNADEYYFDNGYGDEWTVLQGAGDERYILDWVVGDSGFWDEDCHANYIIAGIEPNGTPIKVVRGASTVTMDEPVRNNDYKKTTKVDITDDVQTPEEVVGDIVKEHTVTIQDGIAYSNGSPEGNIVTIAIQAPAEYTGYNGAVLDWGKVGYEQSIKNAAGDRLIGEITANSQYNNIIFTYNATAVDETDKKDLEFCIRWEEGYSEKFILKFSEAALLGNLQEAVAPKTLAFNGAPKTMVVGQDQALDVKITKVQNADIICLGYEVTAGKDKMHVDEFGKVTALAEGKATVEVYPMHLVDGKKERIAGAKSAKATITVKKVSAPKVTRVTASDTSITVEYTMLNSNDGYRREIYVVEGKNVKADVIEKKVTDEMKNEQWQGIFAVAPEFVSYSEEWSSRAYDYKKGSYTNTARITISGLDTQKDYTVYVRNVSAVRSFADDCQVSLSVAGTAKSCKTSTILMSDIAAVLKDEEIKEIDYYEVDSTPTQDEIWDAYVIGYEVPLTKKNVQISLEGLFKDKLGDSVYAPIPLAGQDLRNLKNTYAAPKIAYYFYGYIYDGYDARYGYRVTETSGYMKTSSIAAINNKGKITLKQPGWVTIYAVDTVSGVRSNAVQIHITAEADRIAAKNTTMEIGQRIRLENLLVYKQGNTVLDQSNYYTYDRIDVKAAQESLKSAGKGNSFGISDEGYLTAYAKDSVKLTLQDTTLKQSVTVNVKVKDLSPVKNLKAVNVIDNRFDVQFEMNPYAEAYRIEITDARKVIRSIYVENIPFDGDLTIWDEDNNKWVHDPSYTDDDWGTGTWGSVSRPEHYSEHWYRTNNELCRADKTNGKWVLTYRIKKLTQASKYNISVTALYGEAKSKTVKKPAITTKLPAYDEALTGKIVAGNSYYDGMEITVRSGRTAISCDDLVSGNTYNLEASGANQNARRAGTDTLTWTSSNKKVATVQATSGGYGAVLKALKDGETVIEVKSKVLKATVARYTISVSTVGDAYKGRDYYGDNEDMRGEVITKPNEVTELMVGVAEPVELIKGQRRTFKVTLTEEGWYTAYKITNGRKNYLIGFSSDSTKTKNNNTPETWVIGSISGSFTGSVIVEKTSNVAANDIKNRIGIKPGETVPQIQSYAWYAFTAPKAGLYGVTVGGISNSSVFNVYRQSTEQGAELNISDPEPQKYFYELQKDEVVYLRANSSYSAVKIAEAKFETLTLEGTKTVSGGSETWFKFTSEEEDQYEFKPVPNGSLVFEVYTAELMKKSVTPGSGTDDNGNSCTTYTCTIDKNEEVYIRVYNQYSSTSSNISVKKKGSFETFGEDGTCTINHEFTGYYDYLYISYTVPAAGFYTFSSEAVGTSYTKGYGYLDIDDVQKTNWDLRIGSNPGKTSEYYLTPDNSVRIRVRSYNYPETWEGVVIRAEKTGDAPAEITVGSEAKVPAVPANKSVWYSFKATETDAAEYVVTFPKPTGGSGSISAYLYNNVTDTSYFKDKSVNLSYGAFMDAITVGAEETRYLKITNNSSAEIKCPIMIQKVPADGVAVTAESPVDLTLATNWVSFTADADAYYTFSIGKYASNTAGYIYAYKDKEDTTSLVTSAYNGTLSMVLDQNQKIWLNVTATYPAAADATPDKLKVSKGEINTVDETGTTENLKVIEVTESGASSYYAVVKFTANADGEYTFKGTDTNISSLYIYTDAAFKDYNPSHSTSVDTVGDEKSCTVSKYEMNEGDIVYLKINLSATSPDLSLTVSTGTDEGEEEGGEVTP